MQIEKSLAAGAWAVIASAGGSSRRRKDIPAMESWARAVRSNAADTPASLAEQIAALWGEYLDDRDVGTDDDFFTRGGNSLIGIKIIERVAHDYGVTLSVRGFYLAHTPAGVAALIEQGRAQA
ncbi:phosphopantetheine-binding protein [Actinoplanes palleronii]|uniref:Carrier domain-containing protein n=1 Tax=Actinoplanes palleronii TaxID=113570 RepID=A0ABQ4BIY1_9ACTN|nr:phosphopantetheine-binding protein [Actinoplanes palleronii]GIE70629.1 hypothetical protein Apa02nite_067370 [Actinoplanes palleronii]